MSERIVTLNEEVIKGQIKRNAARSNRARRAISPCSMRGLFYAFTQ